MRLFNWIGRNLVLEHVKGTFSSHTVCSDNLRGRNNGPGLFSMVGAEPLSSSEVKSECYNIQCESRELCIYDLQKFQEDPFLYYLVIGHKSACTNLYFECFNKIYSKYLCKMSLQAITIYKAFNRRFYKMHKNIIKIVIIGFLLFLLCFTSEIGNNVHIYYTAKIYYKP